MIKYPNIDPVIFNIYGQFGLRWYSLAYIIGIFFVQRKITKNLSSVLSSKQIESLFNYAILGLIIGARIFFVLFYDFHFYLHNALNVLKVWEGGLSFHGGLAGIFCGVYIFAKKNKVSSFIILDQITLYCGVGIFFGRIANFINSELYGRYTASQIGIIFPTDPLQITRHPSQLYEATLEGVAIFIILNLLNRTYFLTNTRGLLSGLFCILYGILRFFIEFFREPDASIGYVMKYFTQGQILCLIMILIGSGIVFLSKRRNYF